MLGESAGVGIAGLTSFSSGEIGAFERCPEHDECIGVLGTASAQVSYEWRQVESADVFGEVQGVGVVGGMGGDGICVVVDTGDDTGALMAVKARGVDAGGCASGAAKEVDVKEIWHGMW